MTKQETYQSSTHGDIPLSFTGRRLLANEREAVNRAIETKDYSVDDMQLSRVRGDIAQYMSKLEQRDAPSFWSAVEARALAFTMRSTPVWRTPEQQSCDEFIEAAAEFNAAREKLKRCAAQCQHMKLTATWHNPTAPARYGAPRRFEDKSFPALVFEVSHKVTKERVVFDEQTEVMGREP